MPYRFVESPNKTETSGRTFDVVVMHTMEIAEVMCDRIAIVYRGKIAAQGTMAELRQQTSSEGMSLEDLFLKLTGGHHTQRLDAVLDA